MTVRLWSLGLLLGLVIALWPPAPAVHAQTAASTPRPEGALVFPATGGWLAGGFRAYWEAHGGLKQFGYPLSPPLRAADGKTVQWLERARFEYNPSSPPGQHLLLGLLGRETTVARGQERPFAPIGDTRDGTWFEATGHTLRGGFRSYWQASGGLTVYGFPISEEFTEVNPSDQRTYTVQYFERNRLEWHPDLTPAYQISLGLLGRQLYRGGGEVVAAPPEDTPPTPKVTVPASRPPPGPPPAGAGRVTAVGDSVMLGAAAALRQRVDDIEIDAAVSRQLGEGITLIQARRAAGKLGPIVVVHLANNGPITDSQFDRLMEPLHDVRRVVIVNLRLPRFWEAGNNAIIAAGVDRYPNTVLADWQGLAANRPDYFWDDGVHLRPAGAEAYAAMVVAAIGARDAKAATAD